MPLTLVVRRFDPVGEGRAYLEAFEVDAPPGASVLDALLEVAATKAPSLAFQRMCRTGVCGTCGMTVNGRPVLACRAAVDETARDGRIEVGPLPHFRVVRDLVVDMDPFFETLRSALPWLAAGPGYDARIPPAPGGGATPPACVLCGICEADRATLDPAGPLDRPRLEVVADLGLVSRDTLVRLARACPRNILPLSR